MLQPTVSAIRAIGSEFVRRKARPFLLVALALAVIVLAAGGWLASRNAWWWIVEAVLILAALAGAGLCLLAWRIIKRVDPSQTRQQREAVRGFTDKLQRVSDNLQTPQFLIIFRVARDIIRPRKQGFIESLSRDSKALAPDFLKLRQLFEDK